MIKQIITLCTLFLFSGTLEIHTIQAQSLPTGFEEWETTTIELLPVPADFWHTNNFQTDSTLFGGGGVKRTADSYSGEYAVRLSTIIDYDGDTVPAFISVVPDIWEDGIPYTGNPDSLIGYYKCNIKQNDTVDAYIGLSRNGEWEGSGRIDFDSSHNTNVYTRFSMPITLNDNGQDPDTLQLVFGSTKHWHGAVPGTWIQLDSLYFKGTGLDPQDTLGNADFERWYTPDPVEFTDPEGWTSNNHYTEFFGDTSFLTRSEDAHSGSFSVSIITDTVPGQPTEGGAPVSYLHNGWMGAYGPQGGMITNHWPDSITAYYKYDKFEPAEKPDSAVFAVLNSAIMGPPTPQSSGFVLLPENEVFQKIQIDLTSVYTEPSDPDTVMVFISSSNILAGTFSIGSRLWLDDISIYPQNVINIIVTGENGQTGLYVDSTLQMHAEIVPDYALNDSIAWSVDDDAIATIDENGLLTGQSEGTVTVKATSTDGANIIGTTDITVSEYVGMDLRPELQQKIAVYPVPARSILYMEFHNTITGTIQILDITGKTLMTTNVENRHLKTIDVSDFKEGVYFIRLITDHEVSVQRFLVK